MEDVYYHLMRSCAEDNDKEKTTKSQSQNFKKFLLKLEDGLYNVSDRNKEISDTQIHTYLLFFLTEAYLFID